MIVSQTREKIFKERIVNPTALGMVLNAKGEWIIAETDLLDDVVARAPRFDFQTGPQALNRLVVRAIHFFKLVRRFCVGTQRLNIVIFLIGKFMTWNVELESSSESDI